MADERFRLRLALLAGACGLLLSISASVTAYAQAAEEDEDTFEQKIIKNILGGLGVDTGNRAGIDYRERSPLVVPPSRDLPPPEANAANRNPAWPKEQVKKRAAAVAPKQNLRATPADPGTSAALTPDELRRAPVKPGSGRITDPTQSGSVDDPNIGRPSKPYDNGNGSSIFTWDNLTGKKQETATFTGEPSRSNLTQPPPGYQTPSPSAPYGTAPDTPSGWKIPNILSRPEGSPNN